MNRLEMIEIFIDNPIIAAVSDRKKLYKAIESSCKIIFMLYGDIFSLKEHVEIAKEKGKYVFVHVDLVKGFSNDIHSLNYINSIIKPSGIVTTRTNIVRAAKEIKCFVVQRLFALDSKSINDGINSITQNAPDAVEIMPGIIPKITKVIRNSTNIPIITGGLIETKEEIISSLGAGATCISTTCESVWENYFCI